MKYAFLFKIPIDFSCKICSEVGGPSEFKSKFQKFYVWIFPSSAINTD